MPWASGITGPGRRRMWPRSSLSSRERQSLFNTRTLRRIVTSGVVVHIAGELGRRACGRRDKRSPDGAQALWSAKHGSPCARSRRPGVDRAPERRHTRSTVSHDVDVLGCDFSHTGSGYRRGCDSPVAFGDPRNMGSLAAPPAREAACRATGGAARQRSPGSSGRRGYGCGAAPEGLRPVIYGLTVLCCVALRRATRSSALTLQATADTRRRSPRTSSGSWPDRPPCFDGTRVHADRAAAGARQPAEVEFVSNMTTNSARPSVSFGATRILAIEGSSER